MSDIDTRGYAQPTALVSTDWVASHLHDPGIRLVESNEDTLLYASGHIEGAVHVDWTTDLNDRIKRDYVSSDGFESIMRKIGATKDTMIVFYGDKSNWWACYAFWVFQLFGHRKACVMDGGRLKWEKEKRPLIREVPHHTPSAYRAAKRDDSAIRAFRDDVLSQISKKLPLVDVRSPEEYSGERLHMPNYPNEGALRGGHIPGARNVPWSRAVNPDDGTFKSSEDLKKIYLGDAGLSPKDHVIAYCRIGERSSHTWFVLTYLLGFKNVRNYDGSWTEWGNLVNVPIER